MTATTQAVQEAIVNALRRVGRGNIRILQRETSFSPREIRVALRTLSAAGIVDTQLRRGRLIVSLGTGAPKPGAPVPSTPLPSSPGLAEARVREIVDELLQKMPPESSELTVKVAEGKPVTVKTAHVALKETLRRVAAGFVNFFCVGPAGSGKSTLAHQLAQTLKREYGFISLSGGTTEGQLLGRLTSDGKYLPARFVELFERGGVFLLDEGDAADANVLLVLNAALANGSLAVPNRVKNPVAKRHPDFILIVAANTYGQGADFQYVGRNQLDAAFLSRFAGSVIPVDYDEALESQLVSADWHEAFKKVRSAAQFNRIRRVLGTRELIAGEKLLKAGYARADVWNALTLGWSADERAKAGAA